MGSSPACLWSGEELLEFSATERDGEGLGYIIINVEPKALQLMLLTVQRSHHDNWYVRLFRMAWQSAYPSILGSIKSKSTKSKGFLINSVNAPCPSWPNGHIRMLQIGLEEFPNIRLILYN